MSSSLSHYPAFSGVRYSPGFEVQSFSDRVKNKAGDKAWMSVQRAYLKFSRNLKTVRRPS
jgi:hypothetical protein